jgi:hypothetical protein
MKCVRTMAMLAAAGRLGGSGSFPRTLPGGIERHLARDYQSYAREILALARRTGADPGLAVKVERHVRKAERRARFGAWLAATPFGRFFPAGDAATRMAQSVAPGGGRRA